MTSNPAVTVRSLLQKKRNGEKISMLTAYDYPTAYLLDEMEIDCILVGDSLGMVVQGHKTTVPVTLQQMIYHGEMVSRAVKRAMVIVDLPFPVGQRGVSHTVKSAAKIMKKTMCQAVKMEGGHEQSESIEALVDAGIPTIAHIGLRPQSVHALGGYRVQRDACRLMQDAQAAEAAGACMILMECVPQSLAKQVTDTVKIPTIGIGAGSHCDGQVLVLNDVLGMSRDISPKFVRQYCNFTELARESIKKFKADLTDGSFPSVDESFE